MFHDFISGGSLDANSRVPSLQGNRPGKEVQSSVEEQKLSPSLDTQVYWALCPHLQDMRSEIPEGECQFHSNQRGKENIKVVSSHPSPRAGIVSSLLLFPSMVHVPQGL